MFKRMLMAVIAVFFVWSVLDFVIHGVLLQSTYEATEELWRPMLEMKVGLMYGVTFVFSACFVAIYGLLVSEKSLLSGVKFGVLFGLATGISMGFGSYSYMPIPLLLAWSWSIGTLIQSIISGFIVGALVKPKAIA